MYQRYYKQRKIGRIASVFVVLASGTWHFSKNVWRKVISVASIEGLKSKSEFLPVDLANLLNAEEKLINERQELEKELEIAKLKDKLSKLEFSRTAFDYETFTRFESEKERVNKLMYSRWYEWKYGKNEMYNDGVKYI